MIKGSGIDIVEIEKLEKAVKRWGDIFLKRVFTDIELAYSKKKRYPMQHLAARFAAKEAIFKAFNDASLGWKDIEILNDDEGRPYCVFLNGKGKNKSVFVSISHVKTYAVASAIITKKS